MYFLFLIYFKKKKLRGHLSKAAILKSKFTSLNMVYDGFTLLRRITISRKEAATTVTSNQTGYVI